MQVGIIPFKALDPARLSLSASGPRTSRQVAGRAGPYLFQLPFKLHITSDGAAVNGPPCAIQRQINLFATPWGDKGIDSGKVLPCKKSCSLIIMINSSLLTRGASSITLWASPEGTRVLTGTGWGTVGSQEKRTRCREAGDREEKTEMETVAPKGGNAEGEGKSGEV